MAVDSTIARPTKSVRVMVEDSSGCWAMDCGGLGQGAAFAERRPDAADGDGDAGCEC